MSFYHFRRFLRYFSVTLTDFFTTKFLEAKQEDFTAKLTKKVETNKNKPDPKDVPAEQIDFRNQLKNRGSVKTKVDQKFKPQQVDFRTQLKNQGKPLEQLHRLLDGCWRHSM